MRVINKSKKLTCIIAFIAAIVFCTSFFAGCHDTVTTTEQVFLLDKTIVELTVDGVELLSLNIVNIDETPIWESSDDGVVTVTVGSAANRATVRGVSEGAALIKATAGDNTVVCAVTVKPGIYINTEKSVIDLWKGFTETISIETNFTGTVTYASSNPSVATVSDSGLVSAVAGGKATVTISAGNKNATVTVNVTEPVVTLDTTFVQLTLDEGENTAQLTATADGAVEWHSEDPEVATVDRNGLVSAVGQGETTVTATFMSGVASCVVKVKDELLSVSLDRDTVTLTDENRSATIAATVSSNKLGALTGDEGKVTWSIVSGGNLVTIDQNGVVTRKNGGNYGTATVRATSVKDPDVYADCTVNCPDPYADWIAISDKASLEAALSPTNENKSMYLTCNIDLEGATLNSNMNRFAGTFDGKGYTISNFHGTLCHNLSGTIKNLNIVCSTEGIESNFGALMHHVNADGTIKNCMIDVTFVQANTGGIACFSQGKVENVIILARNTDGVAQAYAAMVQGGTFANVYYVAYGSVQSGGATALTEAQLKTAATFNETWEDGWVIVDGQRPVIKNANVQEPLKIVVDKTTEQLYVGENTTITAVVTPFDLSEDERAVVWSSSDTTIATVDKDGVVTALKAGTATVRATSAAEGEKYAECVVTVKAVTLAIDPEDVITALKIGSAKQLHATANRGGVIWESSDSGVATVKNGLVTAIADGTVTITARSALDGTVSDSMTIEVRSSVVIIVTLNKTALNLDRDATAALSATVTNSDGGVAWVSSNTSVATVDADGVVTTYGVDGTATITATATEDDGNGNYASAECVVTVKYVEEVITVESASLLIATNSSVTLSDIAKASKGSLALSLKSGSTDGVISIKGDKISALSAGTATVLLTWSIDYSDVEDKVTEITVEVYEPTIVMNIDTDKRTLKVGESSAANMLHVTMDVMPSDPDAEDVTWTSSNTAVISNIATGYSDNAYIATLTAASAGYTVITASYTVGKIEYKVTCEVAVFEATGNLTAVYNLDTFKSAMTSGGSYYLAHDLDLNGATVTGNHGGYNGKLDGRGFTVSNFTTSSFFMYPDNGCVLENLKLVCTLSNNYANEGILGHHTIGGIIRNCYFDVTFGTNLAAISPALVNHIAGGTLENIIVVTHNPNNHAGAYADFFQSDNTVKNMLAYRADGNINRPQKSVDITEAQFKSAATYNDSWNAHWAITDGYAPELLHEGFPQAHRHTFDSAWTTDADNHWHAANCEHTTEIDVFGAHDAAGLEGECSVCGHFPEGVHRHTYADEYLSDETNHWKVTTCADHDEQIGLAQAHDTAGIGQSCSVCGYVPELSYDITYSPEAGMPSGVWVFWKGDNGEEAAKTCSGTFDKDTLTVTFSENAGAWWATQLFYKDSAITDNGAAKVTMTITSDTAGSITVNGKAITLKAGEAYEFSSSGAGGNALISIQMGVDGKANSISAATITFANITITK